jgi:hypothetical protein
MTDLNGTVVAGYCYSFINLQGKEQMWPDTFARTRAKARKLLNAENNFRGMAPVRPYKRYCVELIVREEAPKGELKK